MNWFFFLVATENINAGTGVAMILHNFLSGLLAILRISLPSMLIYNRRESVVAKYTAVSCKLLSLVQLNIYDLDFLHKL
jgi:hypothetical protein